MIEVNGGLSIGEVARRSGVPASALRYYESIGVLPAPERVSGRRRYEPSVLDWLDVINTARRVGFSLDEVRQLIEGMDGDGSAAAAWRDLAGRKLVEVDGLIEQLKGMRKLLEELAECRCVDLATCAAALRASSNAPPPRA